MKLKKNRRNFILVILILITFTCSMVGGLVLYRSYIGVKLAKESPFSNPSKSFNNNQLIGTWKTKYSSRREEELIIQSDGRFKQLYREKVGSDLYIFETDWEKWTTEILSDGRIYVHLHGAKYFLNGITFADRVNGFSLPCNNESQTCEEGEFTIPYSLYDWIGKEYIDMSGELILNVRVDSLGEIILVHMWSSSDRGFPIFGGEAEIYRRTE